MALNKFALYSWPSGATAWPFDRSYPNLFVPPFASTWAQTPIDENPNGEQYYGLFKTAMWDFTGYKRGILKAQYDLFGSLRQAGGWIRFETKNNLGQFVVCNGIIDLILPGTLNEGGARVMNVKVTFDRVQEV